MDSMIRIEHLKKEFADVTPIKDLSIEIRKGDVIAIIGPSGTGKSTLLRCLNLLEKPTSGKIYVGGEEITDGKCDLSKLRQRMGMVFQSFNLFTHMNAVENVMHALVKLKKMNRQAAHDLAMEKLRLVGLENKELAYPDELSGGQKQRVAIARALAMDPEILLFDEPTSALDPTMVGEVLAVIRDLAKTGMTMLIVTHEMKFARNVSNRVFYMDEGEIYEEGTPEQIFECPTREKTQQFIRQLKIFDKELNTANPDIPALLAELETFCRRHMIDSKICYHLQSLMDELCLTGILNDAFEQQSLHLNYTYSEQYGTSILRLEYPGAEKNLLDTLDPLARKMVDHASREISFSYEEQVNKLRIEVAKG